MHPLCPVNAPDDPRLTAHAAGTLPPDEAARLERERAAAPAARPSDSASGRRLYLVVGAAGVSLLLGAILIPNLVQIRNSASRSVVVSGLRQIGQASLIYAAAHEDKLPLASGVWDYARELALGGGLNDAWIWHLEIDPAFASNLPLSTVLAQGSTELDPAFARSHPAYAVPLGRIENGMPSTTPIAWTRGLQRDGTWSADSPFGTQGGHIIFLGGNVAYYRNVRDQLVRHSDGARTSDIREALPPGVIIGEYTPTPDERIAWANAPRTRPRDSWIRSQMLLLGFGVAWAVGVSMVFYRKRARRGTPTG